MTAVAPRPALELPRLRCDQSSIARDPAKTKVVAMGRRWGKSVLGMTVSLACAAVGGRVAWVVPTYRNGRPLWRISQSAVGSLLRSGQVRVNATERIIEFPWSQGFLAIYSADNPDAIRGEYFNLVVIDEAAMIAEEVWTDVIQPTLADADGDAILISTPKGRNWFWREFQCGVSDGIDVKSWTAPSSANPSPQIQKAYELAKTRVPETTHRQEWDAEFVEDGANIFSPTWWDGQNRFDANEQRLKNQCIARYISWDTAMKDKDSSDYASCTVGDLMPDYTLLLRREFRDKLSFPNLIEAIEEKAHEHNADGKLKAVIIEDKNSGTSAYQTLTAATADPWLAQILVPFMPVGSKRQRAGQAGVWCKQGCVWLPHPSPAVSSWLSVFEEELFSFTGSDSDLHDDQVDSFSQLIIFLERVLAEGLHARTDAAMRDNGGIPALPGSLVGVGR